LETGLRAGGNQKMPQPGDRIEPMKKEESDQRPSSMRAMVMDATKRPLVEQQVPIPKPGPGQVLIRVCACAVCRTDLHVVDGELTSPKSSLTPGHEIVGRVVECGEGADRFAPDTRVGVPWLGWTCGACRYCRSGRENLCEKAKFTGYTLDGGYADYTVADERFCFPIPESYSDCAAAPLLCAGLIGYRCLGKTKDAERLGLYGFGAAAHIICQIARHQGRRVFAFTRPGDKAGQRFAMSMGATWAGDAGSAPPEELDAAIIFAPSGPLVPDALRAVGRGGTVVCGGIHMSDIPAFPYEILWQERSICSVANLTRQDGEEFFRLAAEVPLKISTTPYALGQANQALDDLRAGRLHGAAVLTMN
jgi:propanol-preferring alcohol dehydrogenase